MKYPTNILEKVRDCFETGHFVLEEEDFESFDEYEQALELLDLGPSGFYQEFKEDIDFDSMFIEEYGEKDIYTGKEDNIFYSLIALEYDKNDSITDREWVLGESDNYEELYELFVQYQCQSEEEFFSKFPKGVYQIQLQLEECIETPDEVQCVDVKNQWWIRNPQYN